MSRKHKKSSGNFSPSMSGLKKQPNVEPLKIPLETPQHQQMSGPGEIVALMAGRIPSEDVKKVLEITQGREENNEKERQRQYKAFLFTIIFMSIFAIICISIVSFFLYYLYEKGQNEIAEKLLSVLIGLVAGGIGGYGYGRRRSI